MPLSTDNISSGVELLNYPLNKPDYNELQLSSSSSSRKKVYQSTEPFTFEKTSTTVAELQINCTPKSASAHSSISSNMKSFAPETSHSTSQNCNFNEAPCSYTNFGLISDETLMMILSSKSEALQPPTNKEEELARAQIRLLVNRLGRGAVKKFNSEGGKLKHFPVKVRSNQK